ncbi:MAG: hypothetical protein ACKVK0_08750 [Pirellulales bacterium]|jgi:hypothetical protein
MNPNLIEPNETRSAQISNVDRFSDITSERYNFFEHLAGEFT